VPEAQVRQLHRDGTGQAIVWLSAFPGDNLETEERGVIVTEPRFETVEVTPELALKLLDQNEHNRNLRDRALNALVADMKAGDYNGLNGETLKFTGASLDDPGTIVDGQHRLYAAVRSDKMVFVFGVSIDDQTTIDVGVKRSLGDALKLRGESNYTNLAAIVRRVWQIDNGHARTTIGPTNHQALRLFDSDAESFRTAARVGHSTADQLHMPVGIIGASYYKFAALDQDDADDFFDRLKSGIVNLDEYPSHKAIYVMRRWLENRWTERHKRTNPVLFHAVLIKAWNAYREGNEISTLVWNRGGSKKPEPFPEPM
jgi:hypothetical protein